MASEKHDLIPVIIEDFDLTSHVDGMSEVQRGAYYKGFSLCFSSMIKAMQQVEGIYPMPGRWKQLLDAVSDQMLANNDEK